MSLLKLSLLNALAILAIAPVYTYADTCPDMSSSGALPSGWRLDPGSKLSAGTFHQVTWVKSEGNKIVCSYNTGFNSYGLIKFPYKPDTNQGNWQSTSGGTSSPCDPNRHGSYNICTCSTGIDNCVFN